MPHPYHKKITSFFQKPQLIKYKYCYLFSLSLIFVFWNHPVLAQSTSIIDYKSSALQTFWLLISGILVFSMNAGFAMLEAGFSPRKNFTNILAKNLIVFCISTLAFWAFGFSLMFSNSDNSLIGGIQGFFFYTPFSNETETFPRYYSKIAELWSGRSFAALFFFELVLAGTTASIISGAVAERIKFRAFVLFSFILVAFIYPFVGHWVWSDRGLLNNTDFLNFQDFAGATVVHSVGGAAALSGALLLGTRLDYEQREQPEHKPNNLGFCALGCFILWIGWFGFNGGSAHNLENVPHIFVTTMMSSASGGIAVLFFVIWFDGQRKLDTIINGILGGLVGITAACAYVELRWSILIGIISGLLVLFGEYILKLCQIDDPVSAIPVHLFCGFWGTLAVGLFCDLSGKYSPEYIYKYPWVTQTFYQFLGWLMVVTTTFLLSSISWLLIGNFLYWREQMSNTQINSNMRLSLKIITKNFINIGCRGIRVSPELERIGSDDF
ncbi:ammonium transporter, partial [Hyella patelloides]|uniref:ammonium transporter n=1 Tax=Hyella patelloides TaxID=1982969 RepID=UPI00119CC46D